MTNEIFFYPLLPIIPFATIKDAVNLSNKEKRHFLCIFFKDKGNIDYILNHHTRSGGTVVNQVMLHFIMVIFLLVAR